jgi:hypothetical protein
METLPAFDDDCPVRKLKSPDDSIASPVDISNVPNNRSDDIPDVIVT